MQIGIYNKIIKVEEPIKIDSKNLNSYIDTEAMYEFYLGYSINTYSHFKSPFSNDSTPSFKIKFSNSFKLTWKCFSTGKGGDLVDLVSELYNLSFKDSLNKIVYDYSKFSSNNKRSSIYSNFKSSNINTNYDYSKIEVILFDKFPKSFIDYWKSFYIDEKLLELYDIKPAKEVWINDRLYSVYRDENIVIRYLVNQKYKIYKPLEVDKKYKWRTTFDSKCIFGFKQLDYSLDTIIISKSSKDVLVWRLLGYNAITLPTEASRLWKELVEWLYSKFKYVISVLDNDIAGIRAMESYKTDWGIPYIILPDLGEENQCKDLAEIIYSIGDFFTKSLINVLIKNKKLSLTIKN